MLEFDLLSEAHLGPADIEHTAMPLFRLTLAAIGIASAPKIVREMSVPECEELADWIEGLVPGIPLPGAKYARYERGGSWWQTTLLPVLKRHIERPNVQPYQDNKFDRAKAVAQVEGVAARYTKLIPAGSGKMKGCCPIHDEKTPSFIVNLEKQNWHCYGACNTGGDVIALVQNLMKVNKWQRQA